MIIIIEISKEITKVYQLDKFVRETFALLLRLSGRSHSTV